LVFQSVQAFADLDLAQEEFLLLLAILISSSSMSFYFTISNII